jgi:hypothetical protein
MGMGLRFEQDSYRDDGICALGQWDLVKIWAGKWEYDPPFRTLYKQENVFDKGLAVSSWCFTWSNTQDQMPRKFQKHMY